MRHVVALLKCAVGTEVHCPQASEIVAAMREHLIEDKIIPAQPCISATVWPVVAYVECARIITAYPVTHVGSAVIVERIVTGYANLLHTAMVSLDVCCIANNADAITG